MTKFLLSKLTNSLKTKKEKSKRNKVFIVLASIVFLITIYSLMMPAITMEDTLVCTLEEHSHTDECYTKEFICEEETEENKNDESCYEKVLTCDKEEHTHDSGCYENSVDNTNDNITPFEENAKTFASTRMINDNSSKLDIIQGANTYDLIEVNLYDYGSNINDPYNKNKKRPGFQHWDGTKAKDILDTNNNLRSGGFNFGDSIVSDLEAGLAGVTQNATGTINETVNINGYGAANAPTGGYLKKNMGANGYPQLNIENGQNLGYLFGSNSTYTSKANSDNINGLFQYNETTGEYYYNSRDNHAQFNASNNTFTLYKQLITSNFMMYPFGNFLPFNDINTQTTQASTINRNYFVNVANSAATKATDTNYSTTFRNTYSDLSSALNKFVTVIDSKYGNQNWDAGYLSSTYLNTAIPGINATIPTSSLDNVYSIDFDEATDFYFGLEMKMTFMQPKGGLTGKTGKEEMKFYFTGDDDVWVFIDDMLFLDLSGIHRHVGGNIDFVNGKINYYGLNKSTGDVYTTPYKTVSFTTVLKEALKETGKSDAEIEKYLSENLNEKGTFKDYSNHTFHFYYMERGSGSGVMRMNFNMPLLKKNSISVTKELSVDTGDIEALGNPDFSFQILDVDNNGNKTNTPFILEGTTYEIYENYDTSRTLIGTGTVSENGIFSLKAGQTAVFSNISEDAGKYYVREILDSNWVSQYKNVIVDGQTHTTDSYTNIEIGSSTFAGFESGIKDISDGSTVFIFNNKVDTNKYGSLKINKILEGDNTFDKQFKFKVTLDGILLPIGTKYIVEENGITEEREVSEAGEILITPSQIAIINNILAGSNYKVEEINSSINDYTVKYNGQEEGIIVPNTEISITVTNVANGAELKIPIKKIIANSNNNSYSYDFELIEVKNEIGEALETNAISKTITIDVIDENSKEFVLKYERPNYSNGNTSHYYKISEIVKDDNITKYDDNFYVIKVVVTKDSENNIFTAEVTNVYDKNGNDITSSYKEFIFTNYILTDLSISKKVINNEDISGNFEFDLLLTYNDSPLTGTYKCELGSTINNEEETFTTNNIDKFRIDNTQDIEDECIVTFDGNGKASITLANNEIITIHGLPYKSKYTITELTTNGYTVEHQVNLGNIEIGNSATADLGMDNNQIEFINVAGYELPTTGSSGTLILLIIGSLLLIVPVIYIKYMFYKHGKKVGNLSKT